MKFFGIFLFSQIYKSYVFIQTLPYNRSYFFQDFESIEYNLNFMLMSGLGVFLTFYAYRPTEESVIINSNEQLFTRVSRIKCIIILLILR